MLIRQLITDSHFCILKRSLLSVIAARLDHKDGAYLSVALHQHNITDDEGLYVAAGVYKVGRAKRAGGAVYKLKKEHVTHTHTHTLG